MPQSVSQNLAEFDLSLDCSALEDLEELVHYRHDQMFRVLFFVGRLGEAGVSSYSSYSKDSVDITEEHTIIHFTFKPLWSDFEAGYTWISGHLSATSPPVWPMIFSACIETFLLRGLLLWFVLQCKTDFFIE